MNWLSKLWRKMFPKPRWGHDIAVIAQAPNEGLTSYVVGRFSHMVLWAPQYYVLSRHDTQKEAEAAADKLYGKEIKTTRMIK